MNNKKIIISIIAIVLILISGLSFYFYKKPKLTELEKQGTIGDYILTKDFQQKPILPIKQTESNYKLTDSLINGPTITYANPPEGQENKPKNELNIEFPKNYPEPINIKLDEQRIITIKDNTGIKYNSKLIEESLPLDLNHESRIMNQEISGQEMQDVEQKKIDSEKQEKIDRFKNRFENLESTQDLPLEMNHESRIMNQEIPEESNQLEQSQQLEQLQHLQQSQHASYLKYQSKDKRISTYYAYQKANSQRTLKHWTIYSKPNKDQEEKESYQINNAKLKLNNRGEVEVYYFGEQDLKNEEVKTQVDSNLMERAQRTLQKELGEDILNTNNHTPDFIIPAPYYITKNQERKTLSWELNQDSNTISLNFKPSKEEYPIGLDPTLEFIAPGQKNSSDVIGMGSVDSFFGYSLAIGDLDDDGDDDLAVGAIYEDYYAPLPLNGKVYIFYNDGTISDDASGADHVISGGFGEDHFGCSLVIGDLDDDGDDDLAVSNPVSEYLLMLNMISRVGINIFYNDGDYPDKSTQADEIISASRYGFGMSLIASDFNGDDKIDLAVGDVNEDPEEYVYIFYNDGNYPESADDADFTISGYAEGFGAYLVAGDLNYDGDIDLIVGSYFSEMIYIFYNDGTMPTTSATADVVITGEAGENYFGTAMACGDFNYDGRVDLAVGAPGYSMATGRVYIFYNDGTIPTSASSADLIITGSAQMILFGANLESGDLNYDSRTDLIVGNIGLDFRLDGFNGMIYIFYNDGTIPTSSSGADVVIAETEESYFGSAIKVGDLNDDGRTDLIAGGTGYLGGSGRVCVFYNDGSIPTSTSSADLTIVGDIPSDSLGEAMTSGDFNADGKVDLAVGTTQYGISMGAVYIFYNDGNYPEEASGANLTIVGADSNNYFGSEMIGGDFNGDNRDDLVVGADDYNNNTGRVYIFYNDGSIPTTASGADVIIDGQSSGNNFGSVMTKGDLNSDGRTDLIAGSVDYSSDTGRVYVFYGDGSIPSLASGADLIITGASFDNEIGSSMTSGDFNHDGREDLALSGNNCSASLECVYLFYNDGSIPTSSSSADLTILGENYGDDFATFGLTSGDFNHDGREDLAVGAGSYDYARGRAYVFYNDGTIPTNAVNADIKIDGEVDPQWTGDEGEGPGKGYFFGLSLSMGDLNADGREDLIVGTIGGYSDAYGLIYVFYNDGTVPTLAENADVKVSSATMTMESLLIADLNADGKDDLIISDIESNSGLGEVFILYSQRGQIGISESSTDDSEADYFGGVPLVSGDFNDDGDTDLAASSLSEMVSTVSKVYVFYNNSGSISTKPYEADVIIVGDEEDGNYFGSSLASGDLNYDGSDDLIVGDTSYLNEAGRIYIFYGDGNMPSSASDADVKIDGEFETNSNLGNVIVTGDFNYDGRIDLATSTSMFYSTVYIFYNDGTIPTTAETADVTIAGYDYDGFGTFLVAGDFNYDGRLDLAASSNGGESDDYGRIYIFNNDGTYPASVSGADISITAESTNDGFGRYLVSGDFNYDGRVDLATTGGYYFYSTGQVYVFYNDGSIPALAEDADVIIIGEEENSGFGFAMVSGDFNDDGRTDLAVSSASFNFEFSLLDSSFIYIFYNDGTMPTLAVDADLKIEGKTGEVFGASLCAGDFDNDTSIDLAAGSMRVFGSGSIYIFYNDGTMPDIYSDADISIMVSGMGNEFGVSLISGDFNNDAKTDLAVGAPGDDFSTGRVYLFYNDGSMPTVADSADLIITGEDYENFFGSSLSSADLNSDNQTDLIVGAKGYSTNKGRVYIIYNDGSYPTLAANADIKIDGENNNDNFGYSITTGDIIGDFKTDLIIGATGYSTNTGRTYIINNDGSIPTLAVNSDIKIDGQNSNDNFGISLITGDFDYDMDNDLVVGSNYNTNTGRAYIFNNDGSYPTLAANSEIKIDGELANNYFSSSFTKGDLNNDNRIDLVIGAYGYSSNTGRVYIFNNDGTIPTTATTADDVITGERSDNYFGYSLGSEDYNSDNKTDLAIVSKMGDFNLGKTYVFYNSPALFGDAIEADVDISTESGDFEMMIFMGYGEILSYFNLALISGDFDGNRKIDICVGLSGGFKIYTLDAEGTKPDYVKNRGGGKVRGTVRMR